MCRGFNWCSKSRLFYAQSLQPMDNLSLKKSSSWLWIQVLNYHLAKTVSLDRNMSANDTHAGPDGDNTDFRYFIYAVTYTVILVPGLIGNILALWVFYGYMKETKQADIHDKLSHCWLTTSSLPTTEDILLLKSWLAIWDWPLHVLFLSKVCQHVCKHLLFGLYQCAMILVSYVPFSLLWLQTETWPIYQHCWMADHLLCLSALSFPQNQWWYPRQQKQMLCGSSYQKC